MLSVLVAAACGNSTCGGECVQKVLRKQANEPGYGWEMWAANVTRQTT